MSPAQSTTVVDDERVRITTWTFEADGDAIGWHLHEYDYIVVPVTGGRSRSPTQTATYAS